MKKRTGIAEELRRMLSSGRRRQGLTQSDAGKLLGVTQEMISSRERNALKVKLKDLIPMLTAYGVEIRIGDMTFGGTSDD